MSFTHILPGKCRLELNNSIHPTYIYDNQIRLVAGEKSFNSNCHFKRLNYDNHDVGCVGWEIEKNHNKPTDHRRVFHEVIYGVLPSSSRLFEMEEY